MTNSPYRSPRANFGSRWQLLGDVIGRYATTLPRVSFQDGCVNVHIRVASARVVDMHLWPISHTFHINREDIPLEPTTDPEVLEDAVVDTPSGQMMLDPFETFGGCTRCAIETGQAAYVTCARHDFDEMTSVWLLIRRFATDPERMAKLKDTPYADRRALLLSWAREVWLKEWQLAPAGSKTLWQKREPV